MFNCILFIVNCPITDVSFITFPSLDGHFSTIQYSQTPAHWDPCRMACWGAESGSRYHTEPHYQCSKFHHCILLTDALIVWHCRVPRPLETPETVTHWCMLPLPYLLKQDDSDLHMWVRWAWVCGSRCHTGPRCLCRMSHRCSLPTGELTVWRCMALPLYPTPASICHTTSCQPSNNQASRWHSKR